MIDRRRRSSLSPLENSFLMHPKTSLTLSLLTCFPDTGEKFFQFWHRVISNNHRFLSLFHCRSRIGGRNFLLNSNGRSNAFDFIYLWFIELSHKLSGIGRKTFYITALTLCVKGIKYQRRLSDPDNPVTTVILISWEYRINPFKVVELSSLNDNVFLVSKSRICSIEKNKPQNYN